MAKDHFLSTLAQASRRGVQAAIIGAITAVAVIGISPSALAIFVGATPNTIPNTAVNPASYGPSWTKGDPGWANPAHTNNYFNAVYIGDGWVLSADHTGVSGINFGNEADSYERVPNQTYRVANPTGVPGLTMPYADLQLYRIQRDPGLPSLTIASQPLALNDEVVYMSYGLHRALGETHWNVDNADPPNWTVTTTGPGTYSGYQNSGAGKVWGTNNIVNDNILGDDPGDNRYDATDADITTNIDHFTISYLTQYDRYSSNQFETLAVGGDSGSPVFHKRNGQWELCGITLALYTYPGNPDSVTGVYGDANGFADLSSYNQPGTNADGTPKSEIMKIINAHKDYSVVGDLNLDGTAGAADDIAAFIAGWGTDNHTGQGTMASWKNGDLNHDGKTDVLDFLKMRSGLSPGAAASLQSLLGGGLTSGDVPEPSAILLALGALSFFAFAVRKRRERCGL